MDRVRDELFGVPAFMSYHFLLKIIFYSAFLVCALLLSEVIRDFAGIKDAIEEISINPSGDRCAIITVDRSGPRVTILQIRIYKRSIVAADFKSNFDELVFADDSGASARMRWEVNWKGDRLLVLDNSDIGTVTWKSEDGDNWVRQPQVP